jgi:heme-degrading monooxygenase HmoA
VSLRVRPGEQAAFEQAFQKARRLLPGVEGYESHELRRSLDSDDAYVLLTEWRAIESVTLGFRKSREFARWHELLASFVASAPQIGYFGPDIPRSEQETSGSRTID